MAIPKPFLSFLKDSAVKHEVIAHRRVFTAHDKAATLHVDEKVVAKTAVFQVGLKEHVLVLVPASRHIDKKKVKTAVNVWLRKQSKKPESKVDFATEQWMKKNLKGEVGSTPPFTDMLKLHAFVDNALLKQPKLYLNSGDYEHSFLVNQAAFQKVLGKEFMKGAFTAKK